MAKPKVVIIKEKGTLGGSLPSDDGVALLVITAPVLYTFTGSGIVKNLDEAEDAGFTEAKDLANDCMVWEHIKDFYSVASAGAELHIILLDPAVTLVQLFTPANANYVILRDYLAAKSGKIRLVGVALNPTYAEAHTSSISADLQSAIPLADAFADLEFAKQRPIEVVMEGRKFAGTATAALDLSALNAGEVAVMVARDATRQDALITAGNTGAANYAQVGLLIGVIASIHVGRNIGRVLNGKLPVAVAEFSGGQIPYDDFTETDLETLYDKGYIFYDRYNNVDGWFFVDDRTCTVKIDTDAHISLNRVINKACRVVLQEYVIRLKDDLPVDETTGLLKPIVLAGFETDLNEALRLEMVENTDRGRAQEASGATVTIDPNQNVLATEELIAEVEIVPLFIARKLTAKIKLVNPASL